MKTHYSKCRIKTQFLFLITLTVFGGAANLSLASGLTDVTKASDKAQGQIQEAVSKRNAGLLSSLFTSNGAIITPKGRSVSGRTKIRMAAKLAMIAGENGKLTISRDAISMIDNTAYETGSYSFRPNNTKSKLVTGHYTIIWRLEEKTWKIHRAIGMK